MVEVDISAITLNTRANPEIDGAVQFSAFSTGFCIDPDGVVATCWHNLEGFLRAWSPVDIMPVKGGGRISLPSLEKHEFPRVAFMASLEGPGVMTNFPILSCAGNVNTDILLLELGGRGKFRPLPHMELDHHPVQVGETVSVIGVYHPPGIRYDDFGLPADLSVAHHTATVLAADAKAIYLDIEVPKGHSGGPVIRHSTMKVVAMTVEVLPAVLAEKELHISRPLTRAVRLYDTAHHLVELRGLATDRQRGGGAPWCGTQPIRRAF